MKSTTELPDDPALPALAVIGKKGLEAAIPALGLDGESVDLLLRRYHPCTRATLEARAERRRFAVKVYAEDPASEAALYEALASVGLTGDSAVRVPPLLVWERQLRVLVLGWLEGPTAAQLLEQDQGERAGGLAAGWLQRAASLRVKLGVPFGAARRLDQARKWANTLGAADPALGTTATALAARLSRTQPQEGAACLAQGSLYAHHVLDLGDGVGLIDWQKSGQGPAELDAGTFLATIWRLGLLHGSLAGSAARAEKAFLAGTEGLLEQRALAWHRAATLLRLAQKFVRRQRDAEWRTYAHALLGEATRLAEAAG